MNKIFVGSLLIITISISSCGKRNDQKPPFRDDSYIYWNNANECIEIYCGSLLIGSNRGSVEGFLPEQWSFKGESWKQINIPESMGRVSLIFDEKQSELLLLPLWSEDNFYAWNGEDWAIRGKYPTHDFSPANYCLVGGQNMRRIEMVNFEKRKRLYLESSEWIDDSSSLPEIPFTINPTVQPIYNSRDQMYIVSGIVEEFPMHRIFGITHNSDIKELGCLPTGYFPMNICYNYKMEKLVIIISKNDEFGVFDVDQCELIPSENAPNSRFGALFAYDHNSNSIVMFGGFRDRFPIMSDKYYQDTWLIQYSEDSGAYIWKRIN